MSTEIHRLDASRVADFLHLHALDGGGWCYCAAWWVPEWKTFADHTAEQNRSVREGLFAKGEFDGYLLYEDGVPAGWCQVGPRDRLPKLVASYGLSPDPETWAITCFFIAPDRRRSGIATRLLNGVIEDLRARGVRRVEAFPKRTEPETTTDMELWTGPEAVYRRAGFNVAREDARLPVMALDLGS